MPKVSVVSTVHNGSAHIDQVTNSILGQDFESFEWLILDDRSTDETPSLLADLADDHPKITIITPGERLGRARGLNRVIDVADGEYIAQQDFDDFSYPHRLSQQVAYLDEHERIGAAGAYYERIDDIRGERYIREPPTDHYALVRALTQYIPLAHTLAIFRKCAWQDAGGYPIVNDFEDIRLWIRMVDAGWRLANVPDVLGKHFVYEDSTWNSQFKYTYRQRRLAAVQASAVKQLAVPSWMYLYPLARVFYPYLPSSLKQYVRRTLVGISERSI